MILRDTTVLLKVIQRELTPHRVEGRRVSSRLRALTLIEVVVLLAILAILVGLLLPATRGTREASRRTFCQYNLVQLSKALGNYEAEHGVFPSAMAGTGPFSAEELPNPRDNAGRLSGFVGMLPYLDQLTLYQQIEEPIDFQGVSYSAFGPAPWTASYPPWQEQLTVLLCPSDFAQPSDGPQLGMTNYAFSVGDQARNLHGPKLLRGAFGCRLYARRGDFAKGLSSTIAIAEIVRGRSATKQRARVAVNVRGLLERPSDCLSAWQEEQTTYANFFRGSRWADGAGGPGIVHTILPPNSPSCAAGDVVGDGIYSANSWHPGGVNVAMADGSYQFISDKIDAGQDAAVPMANPSAEGRVDTSPTACGVWGSLGCIDAGH